MSLLPQLGSIDGRCSAAKGEEASIVGDEDEAAGRFEGTRVESSSIEARRLLRDIGY